MTGGWLFLERPPCCHLMRTTIAGFSKTPLKGPETPLDAAQRTKTRKIGEASGQMFQSQARKTCIKYVPGNLFDVRFVPHPTSS